MAQTLNLSQIRVGIVEDHQSIIDGYRFRLDQAPGLKVVGVAHNGVELGILVAQEPLDVLIMDIHVPTGPGNPNPFPILHMIPMLTQTNPEISILIISMIADRVLIQALLDAGARGYILKDETSIIEKLASIVSSIASGSNYVSERVFTLLTRGANLSPAERLTPRQIEAISLCAAHPNWSRADLASALSVTHSTARNLLSGAYLRLGVNNLPAALAKAEQIGLLPRKSY